MATRRDRSTVDWERARRLREKGYSWHLVANELGITEARVRKHFSREQRHGYLESWKGYIDALRQPEEERISAAETESANSRRPPRSRHPTFLSSDALPPENIYRYLDENEDRYNAFRAWYADEFEKILVRDRLSTTRHLLRTAYRQVYSELHLWDIVHRDYDKTEFIKRYYSEDFDFTLQQETMNDVLGMFNISYVITLPPELRLVYINPVGEQLYGLTNNKDLIGTTMWELLAREEFLKRFVDQEVMYTRWMKIYKALEVIAERVDQPYRLAHIAGPFIDMYWKKYPIRPGHPDYPPRNSVDPDSSQIWSLLQEGDALAAQRREDWWSPLEAQARVVLGGEAWRLTHILPDVTELAVRMMKQKYELLPDEHWLPKTT